MPAKSNAERQQEFRDRRDSEITFLREYAKLASKNVDTLTKLVAALSEELIRCQNINSQS